MFKFIPASLTAAVFLGGCATFDVPEKPALPDIQAAQADAAAAFFNAPASAINANAKWWESFDDSKLSFLIETALRNNRALNVAREDINVARAALKRRELDTRYTTQSRVGIDLSRGAVFNQDPVLDGSAGLGGGWEYDRFGRLQAGIDAAKLNVDLAEQARQTLAVSVAGQTALAYIDLRGAQKRLSVAKESAEAQAQSLALLQELFDNGRATALDTSRAQAQYRTTLADLPAFDAQIDSAIARLALLTGTSASVPDINLSGLKNDGGDLPVTSGALALGAPADMLRTRPDIRAAETQIARLSVLSDLDRARLFPVITFNADIFTVFGTGSGFNQGTGIGFNLGPSIVWDGPDLSRVRADIDIADAQTVRAYAAYEQTVLEALADVEIALSALVNAKRRRPDLVLAIGAAQQALDLAQLRFDEGVDDFLDVLDAQRTLLAAQDRLAANEIETTRNAVLTYQELGGFE